jgi:SAM-dependent methyltransferase
MENGMHYPPPKPMIRSLSPGEHRSPDRLWHHYVVELELADRLRRATRQERRRLYQVVYDELFRMVPDHPQLTRKASSEDKVRAVQHQMSFLSRFLKTNSTLVEIGPGDCSLSFEAAKSVREVYAVDVSPEITQNKETPSNFRLFISDGCNIPLSDCSVDVVYSNQLMEHLHPDDALEQLAEIYRVLAPGGVYVCVTPNRLGGPDDISTYYDHVATCFHLKEYTTKEIVALFKQTGFIRVKAWAGGRGKYISVPPLAVCIVEQLLSWFPPAIRTTLARTLPFRMLLGIRVAAMKK